MGSLLCLDHDQCLIGIGLAMGENTACLFGHVQRKDSFQEYEFGPQQGCLEKFMLGGQLYRLQLS